MNRIFFALVVVAFLTAAGRQLAFDFRLWEPEQNVAAALAAAPGDELHVVGFLVAGDAASTTLRGADGATITLNCASPPGTQRGDAIEVTGTAAPGAVDACTASAWVGPMQAVTAALFDSVKAAVLSVVLPLIGAMAFFLGVMKVAEKGGTMLVMAKLVRPLMVRLFPDVPPNHPAMSAMILNIAANALGLGNAATPFGLRAMQELDRLNPEKGTATNAMALFLAINTSSITLLATGAMTMRASLGSTDPAGVIPTTLFATVCSTVVAISSCKILERFVPGPRGEVDAEVLAEQAEGDSGAYPAWASALALLTLLAAIPLSVVYGAVVGAWIVPIIVTGFIGWGWWKGVAVYDAFIEGAKEGFDIAVRIIPYLVAILGTVGMLRGSGAIDAFKTVISPLTAPLGMPAEAVPMVLLRPLSGSGASGLMVETMKEYGPDSYIGYLVSTMQGSSETTFYVLAVYFGSVGITRIRHAMVPGLLADLAGAIGAVIAVQLYFSYNGLWP
ncbi:MAG: nucleoside recognition domain-containing protein [Myxococcota bacterium]